MRDQPRVLLCPNCGAPEQEAHGKPSFPCSYCGAVIRVGPRRGPVRFGPIADGLDPEQAERTRLLSLRAQAEDYDSGGLYAYIETPREFSHLDAIDETSDDFFPIALASFRMALERCAASPGRPELERQVYWLARKLKNSCSRRNEMLRARAVLETAMDAVADPGFRQLLLCGMADMARAEGDLAAAAAFLDDCDPRPHFLDLDTEYRTTRGMLLLLRGRQWEELLELVGRRGGEIPFEPSSIAVFHSLRITALENLGRGDDADLEMDDLLGGIEEIGGTEAFLDGMYADDERRPHWATARSVLERRRARRRPPPRPIEGSAPPADDFAPDPPPRGRKAVVVLAIVAALVMATIIGLVLLN